MVVNWKWHSALVMKPWEDHSWEEPEEAEFPDDDWTDELPRRSSRMLRQTKKRNTNIYGGQGSGFSSKARKRLLPCGRSGCFGWFSNDNAWRTCTELARIVDSLW